MVVGQTPAGLPVRFCRVPSSAGVGDGALRQQCLDLRRTVAVLGQDRGAVLAGDGRRRPRGAVQLMQHAGQGRHRHRLVEAGEANGKVVI